MLALHMASQPPILQLPCRHTIQRGSCLLHSVSRGGVSAATTAPTTAAAKFVQLPRLLSGRWKLQT